MKNNKGIAPLIVVLIVAGILALGSGGYYAVKKYKAPAVQPTVSENQTSTQPTQDETADWKTYTNTGYGFEVEYPSSWKITDTSRIVAINNTKSTAVNIESPIRYDLPGYEGVSTNYRILIYLDSSSQIVSVADFGSSDPKFGHQSAWNINVDKKVRDATTEYILGQQIISSFKLIR